MQQKPDNIFTVQAPASRHSQTRKTQERREEVIIQSVLVALKARDMQNHHIENPELCHKHHLDHLLYLRSGSLLFGANPFVGIGRLDSTTEEIARTTAYLSYEVAWNEVDQVEQNSKTLRFSDLPWPFELALVARASGNTLPITDFPTGPDAFIDFICNPQRAALYGVDAHELLSFERRIWARDFFLGKVLGKVHKCDVNVVEAAYVLMYAMINEDTVGARFDPGFGKLREKFVFQMKEWYSKHDYIL